MLVLGLAALAGIAVAWLRGRRAGGERAAMARRDLAMALALAACWASIWGLYATYTWTAAAGLSTLQAARFYVPALGAISLLGAWLLVRVPRGTVELKPGPGVTVGGRGRVAPGGSGRAVQAGPSRGASARPPS
jgi:hypothetical protein